MHRTVVSLVLTAVAGCLVSTTIWNQLDTMTFQMTELLQCEDKGTGEFDGSLRLSRKNRTLVVLEGNATLQVPLDSSMEITVLAYSWGNGGYRLTYTIKDMNICKDVAFLFGGGWESLWTNAGLTAPIKCPIPKGTYQLKDFDTQDFLKMNWPAFTTGKFKVLALFSRNRDTTRIGCINFVIKLQSTAVVYIWGNGSYRQMYVFKEMNVCTDLATFLGGAWHSIWTHAGLTAPVKCPIPKGTYKLKGFDVKDFLKVNVPAFSPGKFRTVQKFSRTKDKRLLGCIHFVIDLQPKSFNS